jgi:hypothetical protein
MKKKPFLPMSCKGVKCMIVGCRELASHKVGEENIWCRDEGIGNDEYLKHQQFDESHNATTYLCEEHFKFVMKRETEYNTIEDNRFEGRLIK